MFQLHIFGEAPTNRTAVWHPPPTTRGTINILWSCVVTLLLCVWNAVHLNVPEYDPEKSKHSMWNPKAWVTRTRLRKFWWLIVGLLAPEMVAFTAWTQRQEARKLTEVVSGLLSQARESTSSTPDDTPSEGQQTRADPPSTLHIPGQQTVTPTFESSDDNIEMQPSGPNSSRQSRELRHRYEWTHVHSFFCIQGGFASDLSVPLRSDLVLGDREQRNRLTRYTLTPRAIILLAKHNPSWLPNLSSDEIEDKSKADGLAKFLVCVQASWFIIQCGLRLGSHGDYSISLLELNTLAHAICMLLVYCLWWDKPLDVAEPAIIKGVPAARLIERLKSFEEMERGKFIKNMFENKRGLILNRLKNHPPDILENLIDMLAEGDTVNIRATLRSWRGRLSFAIGFAFAGAIYGGLHMLGWNAPFTSHTQYLLWRISAITITASGLFFPIAMLWTLGLWGALALFSDPDVDMLSDILITVSWVLTLAVGAAGILFYLLTRTYLLVECFISLAYLPESTVKQPQWLSFFPHF